MTGEAALVGLIANPASGKDIRRLVGQATTIDNQGKIAILRRVLIGLAAAGVCHVLVMPDTDSLGPRAIEGLERAWPKSPLVCGERACLHAETLSMEVTGRTQDSERAAALLRQAGAGCIIVLGGDGTVRAASKGAGEVPLLPISTGTNNVLPSFVEGTIAGLAAGALARGQVHLPEVAIRHKWLELTINGASRDRALVDVAVLGGSVLGSRAIWSVENLLQVVVTRAAPSSIGISAIAAAVHPIAAEEPRGLAVWLAPQAGLQTLAAVGPGLVSRVGIADYHVLAPNESASLVTARPLVLALDGEREVVLYDHDTATLTLRLDGPWIVDAALVMREMVRGHLLERNAEPVHPIDS